MLVNPIYAPKLYRDVLYMEVTPRGKGRKGQRRKAIARAGHTRVAIHGVVTEASRPSRFVLQQVPGGLFDVYREEFSLTESSVGTEVRANLEYKVSLAYIGTSLNIAML